MSSAKSEWLNWPNALTLSRVGLGVVCVFPLTADEPRWLVLALAIMVAAEATDFLDGFVARSTGSVSEVGKILDPMADAMYRLIVFSAFVQNGWMPAWMLAVFVVRDLGVAYTRVIASKQGLSVASRFSGKAKAVGQALAQLGVVSIFAFDLETSRWLVWPLLWIAAGVTFYSLVDYGFGMRARSAQVERT